MTERSSAGGRMRHVLIVADNAACANDLVDGLRRVGYRVSVTPDGYTALGAIGRARPDVIVSGGVRLAEMLRSQGIRIPFVLVPGHPEGLPHAADALLATPVRIDELAVTIARLLEDASAGGSR